MGSHVPCAGRECATCSQPRALAQASENPEVLSVKPGPGSGQVSLGHHLTHRTAPSSSWPCNRVGHPVVSLGRGRADRPGCWQKQAVTYKLVKINIMTSTLKKNIRVEDILEDIIYITPIVECHGEFISVQHVPSRTVYGLSLNNIEEYIQRK